MEISFQTTALHDVRRCSRYFHRQENGRRAVQKKHGHCYFHFCSHYVLVGQTKIQSSTSTHWLCRSNGTHRRLYYYGRKFSGFVFQYLFLGHAPPQRRFYRHHRLALSDHQPFQSALSCFQLGYHYLGNA